MSSIKDINLEALELGLLVSLQKHKCVSLFTLLIRCKIDAEDSADVAILI